MLICGGEKLYPGIIRKVLLAHPDVEEALIEIEKDSQNGHFPWAKIKLKQGIGEGNIVDLEMWCRKHLRHAEVPKKFDFVEVLEVRKK